MNTTNQYIPYLPPPSRPSTVETTPLATPKPPTPPTPPLPCSCLPSPYFSGASCPPHPSSHHPFSLHYPDISPTLFDQYWPPPGQRRHKKHHSLPLGGPQKLLFFQSRVTKKIKLQSSTSLAAFTPGKSKVAFTSSPLTMVLHPPPPVCTQDPLLCMGIN